MIALRPAGDVEFCILRPPVGLKLRRSRFIGNLISQHVLKSDVKHSPRSHVRRYAAAPGPSPRYAQGAEVQNDTLRAV